MNVEHFWEIVANLRESILSEEQGDLFEPLEKKLIQLENIHELGELAARTFPGRTSDEQFTYHKNNNGLGCADLAIAMRDRRWTRG